MKRYRVGARTSYLIYGFLCILFGIIFASVYLAKIGFKEITTAILLMLVFWVPGAILLGFEFYFWHRQTFAMKGEMSTGVIVEVERKWAGRNGILYNLIIAYHNQNGEQLESSIPISFWDKDRYNKGTKINVYINGNYCCIKKY